MPGRSLQLQRPILHQTSDTDSLEVWILGPIDDCSSKRWTEFNLFKNRWSYAQGNPSLRKPKNPKMKCEHTHADTAHSYCCERGLAGKWQSESKMTNQKNVAQENTMQINEKRNRLQPKIEWRNLGPCDGGFKVSHSVVACLNATRVIGLQRSDPFERFS